MNTINKMTKRTRVLATIISVVFLIVATGTASAVSKRKLKRTDNNGPVKIEVTYLNPIEKVKNDSIKFELEMNTHSVDLEQYDLQNLSFVRFGNNADIKSNGMTTKGAGHHIV